MNGSTVTSNMVLAFSSIWVFLRYFRWLSWYNQLLWGFFFLPISMTALIGILWSLGMQSLMPLYYSLELLAGSLGVVCVVVGVWNVIRQQEISRNGLTITLGIGLGLFLLLLSPQVGAFKSIVPALGMVIVLLIAFLGVLRRDPRASWIVFAVMILALATRFVQIENLLIKPIDFYHYTLCLSLMCFGKAVEGAR